MTEKQYINAIVSNLQNLRIKKINYHLITQSVGNVDIFSDEITLEQYAHILYNRTANERRYKGNYGLIKKIISKDDLFHIKSVFTFEFYQANYYTNELKLLTI